jgi:hypothetical protein
LKIANFYEKRFPKQVKNQDKSIFQWYTPFPDYPGGKCHFHSLCWIGCMGASAKPHCLLERKKSEKGR